MDRIERATSETFAHSSPLSSPTAKYKRSATVQADAQKYKRSATVQAGAHKKHDKKKAAPLLASVPKPGLWSFSKNRSFLNLPTEQLEHIDDASLVDLEVKLQSDIEHAIFNDSPSPLDSGHPVPKDFQGLLDLLGKQHEHIVTKLESECASLRSRVTRRVGHPAEFRGSERSPNRLYPGSERTSKCSRGSATSSVTSIMSMNEASLDMPSPPSVSPRSTRIDGEISAMPGTVGEADDQDGKIRLPPDQPPMLDCCDDSPQSPVDKSRAPVVELNKLWKSSSANLTGTLGHGRNSVVAPQSPVMDHEAEDDEHFHTNFKAEYSGWLAPLIGLPTSRKRVVWDVFGGFLILYDLIVVPLKVFDPPQNTLTDTLDWVALLYWTLNIFATLTVGYLHDGSYETRPIMILLHYLRLWFWIDILVVAPDWTFTLVNIFVASKSNAGSGVKLLRVLRLMRVVRLLRLAKLKWIMASIKDLIDSEGADIGFDIFRMILSLVFINHFVACAWFATTWFDSGPTWVSYHGFENAEWGYQYLTAFHWAITQFTPASMHVQPQNVLERVFAITVVVFGLVGFSYLVGSITGSLSELRRLKEEASKQFWNLRRFLKKNSVSLPLRLRIEKYLEHAWQVRKDSMDNGNLPILKMLTEQLRNELHCAIALPHLTVHPLFKYLTRNASAAMQRMTTTALSRKYVNRREIILEPGDLAQHMSFVMKGQLDYWREVDQVYRPETVTSDEDWITEPAIWLSEWVVLGHLVAATVSEVLDCSSKGFFEAIQRTPQVYDRVCIYARNYIEWLENQDSEKLSDICQGDQVGNEIEGLLRSHNDEPIRLSSQSNYVNEKKSKAAKLAKKVSLKVSR